MIAHFNSLSVEAIERRGGKEGMEGRREVVKAKIWQRTKCTFEKVHVCPLVIKKRKAFFFDFSHRSAYKSCGSLQCPPEQPHFVETKIIADTEKSYQE